MSTASCTRKPARSGPPTSSPLLGVTAQDPGHGPGWHADLRAEDIGAVAVLGPGDQDALLNLGRGPGGHRVGARGPGLQTSLALGFMTVDPGPDALSRDTHRCGDVGLLPAGLMTLDDQHAAVHGQTGVTVGHESLQGGRGTLDKPHPTRRLSPRQPDSPATNLMAGYT